VLKRQYIHDMTLKLITHTLLKIICFFKWKSNPMAKHFCEWQDRNAVAKISHRNIYSVDLPQPLHYKSQRLSTEAAKKTKKKKNRRQKSILQFYF